MNDNVRAFRVGVVVLAAGLIGGSLVVLFTGGRAVFQQRYTVYLRFPEAPGVTVDTPVRKHGVLIGRVSHVELRDEDQGGGVILTAKIDANRQLRRNELCQISTSSLLGDAVLKFVPSGVSGASTDLVHDGDYLSDGIVATDPLRLLSSLEGNMQTAITSIESAANNVSQLAANLNQRLEGIGGDDGQIQRIMQKSEQALDSFNNTMRTLDEVVGDPELRTNLKQSLSELPELIGEVKGTLNAASTTLAGFERVSDKAERNLENIEQLTRPLGERGEDLADQLVTTVDNLEELTGQLTVFSRALNSRDGSLGRLIHDPTLYENLDETVRNINAASRRIRPILDDVRVFTDKIATDPRQLGVRGALDRRPLGVGLQSAPR